VVASWPQRGTIDRCTALSSARGALRNRTSGRPGPESGPALALALPVPAAASPAAENHGSSCSDWTAAKLRLGVTSLLKIECVSPTKAIMQCNGRIHDTSVRRQASAVDEFVPLESECRAHQTESRLAQTEDRRRTADRCGRTRADPGQDALYTMPDAELPPPLRQWRVAPCRRRQSRGAAPHCLEDPSNEFNFGDVIAFVCCSS
jgi:hypothetical protein